MNRLLGSRASQLAVLLIPLFLIVACERPVPGPEPPPDEPIPLGTPAEIPTPIPTPVIIDAAEPYPAPDEAATDQPADTAATPVPADTEAAPEATEEQPAETAPEEASPAEEEAEPTVHVVQAGDTLFRIGQAYGVTAEEIAVANNLADINSLEVGQELIIPAPGTVEIEPPAEEEAPAAEQVHVVRFGDTLFSIGQAYGFTVDELIQYNSLANPNRLEVGQEIRIPPSS